MTTAVSPTIQGFQLDSLLGGGDLGQVFRARESQGSQPAALKLFHARVVSNPLFRIRLEQAAANLERVRLAGVVPLYRVVAEAEQAFAVMEYMAEGSLRSLMQRRARAAEAWPLGQMLDLVRQAADTLALLHVQGLSHGNLKPQNVLLSRPASGSDFSYSALLSDVGIFRMAEEVVEAADTLAVDTLAYAAPEWFQGDGPDMRSDLYSLGVLLYEVATGYLPFEARTFDTAYKKQLYDEPPPPRSLRPELPAELEALILACLQKAPARRPGSVAEVSSALRALLLKTSFAPPPLPVAAPVSAVDAERVLVFPRIYKLNQQEQVLEEPYHLTGDGLTVGRNVANDVILPSEQVHEHQLQIDWLGNRVNITLLEENNQTLLEGQPLTPGQPRTWVVGTMLRIGPYWLRLELPAPAAPAAAAPAAPAPAEVPASAEATPVALAPALPPAEEAVPLATPASCNITLPEEPNLVLAPGRVAMYRVTLTNTGVQTDHYRLSVEGAPKTANIVLSPARPPQINPGDARQVTLSVEIPRVPESRAGDYPVRVITTSRRNPDDISEEATTWTVQPFASDELDMRRLRLRGTGVRRVRTPVTLVNRGNTPASYTLKASDGEEALKLAFPEARKAITVQPGEQQPTQLTVRPQRLLWFGQPQRRAFQVQAEAAGRSEVQTLNADFEQLPLVPWWLVWVALACLLLAGIWFWFSSIPRIADVSLPPAVVLGDRYSLSWQAQNAPTMIAEVGGTPIPIITQTPVPTGPAGAAGEASQAQGTGFSFTTQSLGKLEDGKLRVRLIASNWFGVPTEQAFLIDVVTATPTPTLPPPPVTQVSLVSTVVVVTQVAATPQPSATPPPTATPVVRACERSVPYPITGRAGPGEVIVLFVRQQISASTVADQDGQFTLILNLPAAEPTGFVDINVRTGGGSNLATFQCLVPPAPPATTPTATRPPAAPAAPRPLPSPLPSPVLGTPITRP
ncbi:MAG: protein kinase [Chloroflexaceae bacterium]|jgi:serine/threonine protein kinase|nr:protein kinase [Chloroflexaceae bacterium]